MDIANGESGEKALAWIMCIVESGGDRSKCYSLADKFMVKEGTIVAILILLSLSGVQACGLLYRNSIIKGWKELFQRLTSREHHEFVSLDALTNPTATNTPEPFKDLKSPPIASPLTTLPRYDAMRIGSPHPIPLEHLEGTDFKDPNKIASAYIATKELRSPSSGFTSPVGSISQRERDTADFLRGGEERSYRSPSLSFSTPRAPGASRSSDVSRADWDIRTPAARGGLGLHPPIEDDAYMDERI
ncbi:MAG: hypothetical protein M1822_002468 [Bathelium mastoideum]|nr:MAG: hypothetical protein M1822_002468 [Bathelium mastoideum]